MYVKVLYLPVRFLFWVKLVQNAKKHKKTNLKKTLVKTMMCESEIKTMVS